MASSHDCPPSPPKERRSERSRRPETNKSLSTRIAVGAILAGAAGGGGIALKRLAEVSADHAGQETRAIADKLQDLRLRMRSHEVHSVFAPKEHTEWELVAAAEFGDASASIAPSEQSAHGLAWLASKFAVASPLDAYEFITLDRELWVDGGPEGTFRYFRVRKTDEARVRSEQYRVESQLFRDSRLARERVDVDGYGRDPDEARKDALLKLVRHIYDKTRALTTDFGSHQATPEGFGSDDVFPQDDPRHHERPFQFSRGGSTLQYQVSVFGKPRELTFRSCDAVGYVQNIVVTHGEYYGTYHAHFRVDWVHDMGYELREDPSSL